MLTKVFFPYRGYWSSPFSRWQGQFQNEHPIFCGAGSARTFLKSRGLSDFFDGLVLETRVPQKQGFFSPFHLGSLIGNKKISGPLMGPTCANSVVSVNYAANSIAWKKMKEEKAKTLLENIIRTTDCQAIKKCDLIIEAATQNIPLKGRILW